MNFNDLLQWIANGGTDWEKGLELHNKFGTNINLKNRFKRLGPIDFNRGLLREDLIQIARILEKSQPKRVAKSKPLGNKTLTKSPPAPIANPTPNPKPLPITPVPIAIGSYRDGTPNIKPQTPSPEITQPEKTEDQLTVEIASLPIPLRKLHFKKGKLYNEASKLHKQLEANPQHKRAAMTEIIVENMRENQKIWDELNHFKSKGKIKGDHPDFKETEKKKELKDIAPEVLQKTLTNRRANVSRYKKLIKDNPGEEKKNEQRQAKIDEWMIEIKAIESILNKDAV